RRDDGLESHERQADAARQLGAGELTGEVQRLQHELGDEITGEPGLFQRSRRTRIQRRDGLSGDHWGSNPRAARRACTALLRARANDGFSAAAWSNAAAASG